MVSLGLKALGWGGGRVVAGVCQTRGGVVSMRCARTQALCASCALSVRPGDGASIRDSPRFQCRACHAGSTLCCTLISTWPARTVGGGTMESGYRVMVTRGGPCGGSRSRRVGRESRGHSMLTTARLQLCYTHLDAHAVLCSHVSGKGVIPYHPCMLSWMKPWTTLRTGAGTRSVVLGAQVLGTSSQAALSAALALRYLSSALSLAFFSPSPPRLSSLLASASV